MVSLNDNDIEKIKSNIRLNVKILMALAILEIVLFIMLFGDVHFAYTFFGLYLDAISARNHILSNSSVSIYSNSSDYILSNSSESSEFISTLALESSIFFSISAFVISFCALLGSSIVLFYEEKKKLEDKLRDDRLKKKEDEHKRIEDSISLFYVPLQNLLSFYDKSGSDEEKFKLLNNINGHRHLAEARVRFLFEIYMQRNEEYRKGSRKFLLSLVYRDLENLQKQLLSLNEQ